MADLELVHSPWNDILRDIVGKSTMLHFASPFIKSDAVDMILNNDLRIMGITVFNLIRFVNGSSDLEAVKRLLECGASMYSLWNLHAKVYVFDDCAIITSANLTSSGLSHNTEYGVLIRDEEQVASIRRDLEGWVKQASRIDSEWIESAGRLYTKISSEQQRFRRAVVDELPLDLDTVMASLSGWLKEVFAVVCMTKKTEFTLADIYAYEGHFSGIYPENRNIRAKIRQSLQYLRDMGLVQFVRHGVYRRLL